MHMNVSLIIPAYNEAERLVPFLLSLQQFIRQRSHVIQEIIVVDDGSTDQTRAIAERHKTKIQRLKVITHSKNRGKGAAIKTGVQAAKGDAIIFIDADGATPISEVPKMIDALREADIGIGNRWMKGSHIERHSIMRRFSGWTNRTYMKLYGLGDIDTMCGFKGYRRPVAQILFSNLMENRWLFDTEIAYKARRRGYRIKNFPIRWVSKDGSKLSTFTLIKSGLMIWPLIRKIKRSEQA